MKRENYTLSISKEELNSLPTTTFKGTIHLIDNEEGVRKAMSALSGCSLIGFDTETKPSFKKGQTNQVALLQLSAGDDCYLIRLNRTGLMPEIKAFLEDESICKVGLSIKDDFHNLQRLADLNPGGFIDLQDYVRSFRIADSSLTKIHAIILGKRISKSQQLTNWEAPKLTSKQIQYAAIDAMACVNLYNHLKSGAFKPENSKYKKYPSDEEKKD